MVMKTLAQDFAVYLEAELGYSPLTASSYRYDLWQFFDFLQQQDITLAPEKVTTPLVRKWVVEMHHRGLSNATVGRHLHALRSFWRYLLDCGYVDHDPVAKVSVPKRERRLPKYLGADDLRKLLAAAEHSRSVLCGFRNHAMMATLIFTGMRRGELINLQLGDVSLSERSVTVWGKGAKARVIPLVDEALEPVRDWMELRPDHNSHSYLFTTTHGNRIYPSRMQRIWKTILQRSGIEREGVSLHTLRHSLATLLLQSGECSLVEIQRILGHSRLDTTAIYLHVNEGELRNAVTAHPLAGSK